MVWNSYKPYYEYKMCTTYGMEQLQTILQMIPCIGLMIPCIGHFR